MWPISKLPGQAATTPPRLLLVILILTNFIYYGIYATQRHLAFETGAFDVGVYAQPLWNYLQGRDFAVSLIADNGPLRWATHVEPILFLILPVYQLWPDPRTLLWLQVAGLSLAGLPLYALGSDRLPSEWLALIVVLAYFLLPATEAVTLFDFHAVTFAPLFLLTAIFFLDRALMAQGKSMWLWPTPRQQPRQPAGSYKTAYALSALFFLLALATKEDISLHVFMVGLYLLVLRRRLWAGGTLMVAGLVWFYVTFQVIIPAFRTAGGESIYVAWFESLGDTPLEIALSPITAPDRVLALIFRSGNIPALGMLTIPLAFLPVIGLPFLMMAAPSMAFFFLSQNPTLRQLETWHYATPMLPFVMLATIDGLARAVYYLPHISARRPTSRGPRWLTYLLTLLLLASSLIYHYFRGYSPLSRLQEWPEVTAHHQLGRQLAATIPAEASVLAQAQLIPHVAHRTKLGIWNGPLSTDYDYIWLDLSHSRLPNRFNAQGELLTGLVIETDFGLAAAEDGYLLLKKGARREPIPQSLFTFTYFDQLPGEAQLTNANFGSDLKLVGVKPEIRRLATSETEPQIVLYFETIQKPAADYRLFLFLLDEEGQVIGATDYPQPAMLWWPTSRWAASDRHQVRVNTIPWWTGEKAVFGYAVGLSRSDDPWDVSARLAITFGNDDSNPADSHPIDQGTLLPVAAFRRFGGIPYPEPLSIFERNRE